MGMSRKGFDHEIEKHWLIRWMAVQRKLESRRKKVLWSQHLGGAMGAQRRGDVCLILANSGDQERQGHDTDRRWDC